MKFSPHISRIALPLIAGCVEMICVAGVNAQCPGTGAINFEGVFTREGKPFEAKEIHTMVTYGANATKSVQVVKANLFRGGKGQVRVERFVDGTENPSEAEPMDVLVYDNCGTTFSLIPSRKTAKITATVLYRREINGAYCKEIDPENPPNPGPQGKFENLGHRLIDGIKVRGQRTSFYASTDERSSGTAPLQVTEDWCSTALDTPMGGYALTAKPKREITVVISDIRQIEPDSDLFKIPEGYMITRDDRMNSPSNERPGAPAKGKSER